jgi:cell division protein FtsI/penicillin-binding protein 2
VRTRHRTRGRVAAITALAAAVLLLGGGWALYTRGDDASAAQAAATRYLGAWSRGSDRAAAKLTDQPSAAAAALTASRRGLDGAPVHAVLKGDVDEQDGRATAPVTVAWRVPGMGSFAYRTTLRLTQRGDRWVVRWSPRAIHPRLTAETRLGTSTDTPARGRILARDGRAIVKPRAVVDVAVEVAKVRDAAETARGLAAIDGIDADAAALAKRIRSVPKHGFVPVITLRQADYERVAASLDAIRGVSLNARTSPLPPTKTFARALLGTVGPVTAEQLEKTPSLAPGDEIGQSGLQAAYQERLGGAATRRVVVRDRETGAAGKTLLERPGRRARPLRTTLDLPVQAAAEDALAPVKGNAALVAVQPSTGDILAVANRPADSTYDRALTGLYAPGSTFKVVTTTALLRAGLDVDRTVDCPRTLTVDGKPFRNFEGNAAGAVPFRRDFAQSCNTAFVSLAGELKPNALTDAAADFGLGRKLALGLPAADAKVPPPTSKVGQAAMMIGQDRIVASPLAMAGAAATVAAGRWNAPRLLRSDSRAHGPALRERDTLRPLMRDVVTSGTGTALRDVPGNVIGKSGTAEYGGGDPPPTHAWFIAARDDLAVAVLVEDGRSGGTVAAPIAARFLSAL